jgi:hypothetical protein
MIAPDPAHTLDALLDHMTPEQLREAVERAISGRPAPPVVEVRRRVPPLSPSARTTR